MLCDFDLVTCMIDYPWTVKMIASLMKAHWANLGILSVDVPELTTKILCEVIAYRRMTIISLVMSRLKSEDRGKNAILPFCSFDYYSGNFQSFSHSSSFPVYISSETHFIPKLKIMPIPFIFPCDSITSKTNEEERILWFSERRTMCNFVW